MKEYLLHKQPKSLEWHSRGTRVHEKGVVGYWRSLTKCQWNEDFKIFYLSG